MILLIAFFIFSNIALAQPETNLLHEINNNQYFSIQERKNLARMQKDLDKLINALADSKKTIASKKELLGAFVNELNEITDINQAASADIAQKIKELSFLGSLAAQKPYTIGEFNFYINAVLKENAKILQKLQADYQDSLKHTAIVLQNKNIIFNKLELLEKEFIKINRDKNRIQKLIKQSRQSFAKYNKILIALKKQLASKKSEKAELLLQQKIKETPKFTKLTKGLAPPVNGLPQINFGDNRSVGMKWKGVTFKVANKAKVRSIFDGKIIYINKDKDMNNLFVIDHGFGYMSIYGYIDNVFKKKIGSFVSQGEVLGVVADGMQDNKFYFELRKKGKAVNPFIYIK